jgi:hypothetical protein
VLQIVKNIYIQCNARVAALLTLLHTTFTRELQVIFTDPTILYKNRRSDKSIAHQRISRAFDAVISLLLEDPINLC